MVHHSNKNPKEDFYQVKMKFQFPELQKAVQILRKELNLD